MYILDITEKASQASDLESLLEEIEGIWNSLYNRMRKEETLWVVAPNQFKNGKCWPVSMALADDAREHSNLVLKNIITVHQWEDRDSTMASAYDEILFFVKDKREYLFHKDRIRQAHVYQGNEWGGRREKDNSAYHDTEVRRYNPEGKDPGNVWLQEDRTQTDNQEIDEITPLPFVEAIRRCVLVGSDEKEEVHIFGTKDYNSVVSKENRQIKTHAVDDLTQIKEE
jgi:hypothetical protein